MDLRASSPKSLLIHLVQAIPCDGAAMESNHPGVGLPRPAGFEVLDGEWGEA
jgi:hypothetical protein